MEVVRIKVYATTWCSDCRLAKHVLEQNSVDYEWINIESDPGAAAMVQQLNGGYSSVPTIIFPDGRVLVEPSKAELEAALAA